MKLMVVFDAQEMPKVVRELFFCAVSHMGISNDVYVDWQVQSEPYEEMKHKCEKGLWNPKTRKYDDIPMSIACKIVDDWLISKGMTPKETVLIKHWW